MVVIRNDLLNGFFLTVCCDWFLQDDNDQAAERDTNITSPRSPRRSVRKVAVNLVILTVTQSTRRERKESALPATLTDTSLTSTRNIKSTKSKDTAIHQIAADQEFVSLASSL